MEETETETRTCLPLAPHCQLESSNSCCCSRITAAERLVSQSPCSAVDMTAAMIGIDDVSRHFLVSASIPSIYAAFSWSSCCIAGSERERDMAQVAFIACKNADDDCLREAQQKSPAAHLPPLTCLHYYSSSSSRDLAAKVAK